MAGSPGSSRSTRRLENPLARGLACYADFFDTFGDFGGYVDHFLLNDLVAGKYVSVRFFKAFDDFTGDPLPVVSLAEYREYMRRSMDFITARNDRIAHYASSELMHQPYPTTPGCSAHR
ncbi:MAG: hypothetical protein ABJA74_08700 [Lapillicoccus sp.]